MREEAVRQGDPSERRAYVPVADARRVIGRGPSVGRLPAALAWLGGRRTPARHSL